jgi:hypothetical protein
VQAQGRGSLLAAMVEAAEGVWGWQLRPGYTPGLAFMAHLWQPLRASYRPACFYMATEALHLLGHGALLAAGFRPGQHAGFTYYTFGMPAAAAQPAGSRGGGQGGGGQQQQEAAAAQQEAPLLFLHGVGLGLLPYLDLLLGLAAIGRPLLAPQFRHVSLRWSRCVGGGSCQVHGSLMLPDTLLLFRHLACLQALLAATMHGG